MIWVDEKLYNIRFDRLNELTFGFRVQSPYPELVEGYSKSAVFHPPDDFNQLTCYFIFCIFATYVGGH